VGQQDAEIGLVSLAVEIAVTETTAGGAATLWARQRSRALIVRPSSVRVT